MMQFNWFLFLSTIMATGTHFAGTAVFLHGSGCAGKTSLCKKLIELDPSWKYIEEDGIFYQEAAKYWKNEFSTEFASIEESIDPANVLHAVMRNQILFKTSASNEQRLRAKHAIAHIQQTLNSRARKQENDGKTSWADLLRDEITQIIMNHARNHNVIVDTWFLKPEHIRRVTDNHKVVHVIAYCTFYKVVERTMKRNHEALMNGKDISNTRFFHQALKSFAGIYDLSDNPDKSIASIDKESVIRALDLVEFQLQDSPQATGAAKTFTRGEFSNTEFQEFRDALLSKFTSERAYVVPKLPFDMTVITDDTDPGASALQIISFVRNHENN